MNPFKVWRPGWPWGPLVMLASVLSTLTAWAAEIETVEGEKITGELKALEGDTVVVAPQAAGGPARKIPLLDVQRVVLEPPIDPSKASIKVIDSGALQQQRQVRGSIKLRAGLHRFVLIFGKTAVAGFLNMTFTGPDMSRRAITPDLLSHVPEGKPESEPRRLDAEGFRLPDNPPSTEPGLIRETYTGDPGGQQGIAAIAGKQPTDRAIFPQLLIPRQDLLGVTHTGYIKIPQDGEYTFTLLTGGEAQLYLGVLPEELKPPYSEPGRRWRVSFRGEGLVTGPIESWKDGQLSLPIRAGEQFLKLSVPVARISQAWLIGQIPTVDRAGEPKDSDSAYVLDKPQEGKAPSVQRVSGEVKDIEGDSLSFNFDGQDRSIKIERVVGLVLASTSKNQPAPDQLLQFAANQILPGRWKSYSGGRVGFETTWGQMLDVESKSVAQIITRGGRLVYLNELQPVKVEQMPFFDRITPHRLASPGPSAIHLTDGKSYEHGIAASARTVLHYELAGGFERLIGKVGLVDPEGKRGDVAVRIVGDGRPLYQNPSLKGQDPPVDLKLDLGGIKTLSLEVDFGQGQNVGDRVGWADIRLLKGLTHPAN